MKTVLGFCAVMIFSFQAFAFPALGEKLECINSKFPEIFKSVEGANVELVAGSLKLGNRLKNVSNYLIVPATAIGAVFGKGMAYSQRIHFQAKVNGWRRSGSVAILAYSSANNPSLEFDCVYVREGEADSGIRIMSWEFHD